MNDVDTPLIRLKEILQEFVDQREWSQFHAPKNLAMALAIEAAELMEHFQWISVQESREVKCSPEQKAAAAEELADVFSYTLAIANAMEIDLTQTYINKMAKNRLKYPADEFKGRWGQGHTVQDRPDPEPGP